jgi:hypothetical protein
MRALSIAAISAAAALAAAAPALAGPAQLAVDDTAPALTQSHGGEFSGTLGLTNLTDGALTLSVAAAKPPAGCTVKLSKAAIGAAQSASATLTASKQCGHGDLALALTAGHGSPIPLAPTLKASTDPAWLNLLAFLAVIPFTAFALLVARPRYPLKSTLDHVDKAYSFKDSWVSNVTVIAGLFTGLFASADVVKPFLGDNADSSIALVTVGSAIALIFIGAAPIIVTASQKRRHDHGKWVQSYTVWGMLLGTCVATAGAFGQLWAGAAAGLKLDLGGVENAIWVGAPLTVALLLWYTWSQTVATFKTGSSATPVKDKVESAMRSRPDIPDEAIAPVIDEAFAGYPTAIGTAPSDLGYGQRSTALP